MTSVRLLAAVLLGALGLSGCGDRTDPPAEICPAVFVMPTLRVEPRQVKVEEQVTIEVTTPLASERCTGYPVQRVDYFLDGALLETRQVSNARETTFRVAWIPRTGQHGVPLSGFKDIAVSAKVQVPGWPQGLEALPAAFAGEAVIRVRVTVP